MSTSLLELGRLTIGAGVKQAVSVSKELGDAKDMSRVRKAPVPGYRWAKKDEPTAVEGGEGFKQATGTPNVNEQLNAALDRMHGPAAPASSPFGAYAGQQEFPRTSLSAPRPPIQLPPAAPTNPVQPTTPLGNVMRGSWNRGLGGHNYALGRFMSGVSGGWNGAFGPEGQGWAAGKAKGISNYAQENEAQRARGELQHATGVNQAMGRYASLPGVEAVGRLGAKIQGGQAAADRWSEQFRQERDILLNGGNIPQQPVARPAVQEPKAVVSAVKPAPTPAPAAPAPAAPAAPGLLALNPANARKVSIPKVPDFMPAPAPAPVAAPAPRPPSIMVGGKAWKPGGDTGAFMEVPKPSAPSYSDPTPGNTTSLRTAWGTQTKAATVKEANIGALLRAIGSAARASRAGQAVGRAGVALVKRPALVQGLRDAAGGIPGALFGWYSTPYYQPDLTPGNERTARTLNALFGYMMGRGGVRGMGYGPKLHRGQGFTAGASGMLLTNPAINAVNEAEKSFTAMPKSIEGVGEAMEGASKAQARSTEGAGRKLLMAAGILAAGGLGATGYQAWRDRKQDKVRKGTIQVTLPTRRLGDVESRVDMPLDVLSTEAYKGIMRDTRRRLRAEKDERTQRKGLAAPAIQAGADLYDSFAEPA